MKFSLNPIKEPQQNVYSCTNRTSSPCRMYPQNMYPHVEQKLMSLPKLIPKNNPDSKMVHSATTLSLTCTATHMRITSQTPWASHTKKSLTSTVIFSSVVIPKILIKYLLHPSHDSLGHIGATKPISFHKKGSIPSQACSK